MDVDQILHLAQQLRREGRLDEAVVRYAQVAELYRQSHNDQRLAHTLRHVGDIELEQGRLAEAEPCYREALAIYRRAPDTTPINLANCLRGCALLEEQLTHSELAVELWREAMALYESVGVEAGVEESKARIAALVREP